MVIYNKYLIKPKLQKSGYDRYVLNTGIYKFVFIHAAKTKWEVEGYLFKGLRIATNVIVKQYNDGVKDLFDHWTEDCRWIDLLYKLEFRMMYKYAFYGLVALADYLDDNRVVLDD